MRKTRLRKIDEETHKIQKWTNKQTNKTQTHTHTKRRVRRNNVLSMYFHGVMKVH